MDERTLIIAGFAVLLTLVLAATVLAHLRRDLLAPLGVVVGAALRGRAMRLVAVAGWIWLGWHFLAR
ncbi:hypothetical protein IU433_23790 [Nocardia puris]|uniref:Uncharacterized protein n=1 Tax=Nocardia puris TaxID=208602 RepID=A0A366CZ44_9NOCA|nr:DUF6186 family protein [Nocardia puris]MBF6211959.1 hypothetical protein [Nocardia puris]MBF6366985.1 hypothetical protein [Nocardia puris]MBF6462038.1 hypothetical protein [Nocardia puris]RBO83110.1 hypothetical protein DFR74_11932 [Nocardia puris]